MALFSFGNSKLPKSTGIFNITPALYCASRKLGLCQLDAPGQCYALKAERMYTAVLPYRLRQTEYFDSTSAFDFAVDFLAEVSRKREPVTALRFSEAGDFRNQADVDKAEYIARLLAVVDVKCYCYTARSDLDFRDCRTLVVNGSGFMVHNAFVVTADPQPEAVTCPGNCRTCDACATKNGAVTYVNLH